MPIDKRNDRRKACPCFYPLSAASPARRYHCFQKPFDLNFHTGACTSEVLRGLAGDYNSLTRTIKIHQAQGSRKPEVGFVTLTPMGDTASRLSRCAQFAPVRARTDAGGFSKTNPRKML